LFSFVFQKRKRSTKRKRRAKRRKRKKRMKIVTRVQAQMMQSRETKKKRQVTRTVKLKGPEGKGNSWVLTAKKRE
jgi:hypothetical protein